MTYLVGEIINLFGISDQINEHGLMAAKYIKLGELN